MIIILHSSVKSPLFSLTMFPITAHTEVRRNGPIGYYKIAYFGQPAFFINIHSFFGKFST